MILTYSLPRFKYSILALKKKHTLREDKTRRWREGMSIQHWMHNPRNVSKSPHQFDEGVCGGVQEVIIERVPRAENGIGLQVCIVPDPSSKLFYHKRYLSVSEIQRLALNDGLSVALFRRWFVPRNSPIWKGRIIHFTDLKY